METLIYTVEDEQDIQEIICHALNTAGYKTKGFLCGKDFWKSLKDKTPALILLDIMLPKESGMEILKKLKASNDYKNIPVIFLTAKTAEMDKVLGLDLGADDYVQKPFGVLELISRVKAVIRRCYSQMDAGQFEYKDLSIDTASKEIYKNKTRIALTYKEYELFIFLYQNKGAALSRSALLENLWGYDYEGETRTVDVHIRSLRQKLEDNVDAPKYIATIRGYGYKLLKE